MCVEKFSILSLWSFHLKCSLAFCHLGMCLSIYGSDATERCGGIKKTLFGDFRMDAFQCGKQSLNFALESL